MTHFEHPTEPARHEPEIRTHDLGVKVSCECGWWTTTPTKPSAALAYAAHEREARKS